MCRGEKKYPGNRFLELFFMIFCLLMKQHTTKRLLDLQWKFFVVGMKSCKMNFYSYALSWVMSYPFWSVLEIRNISYENVSISSIFRFSLHSQSSWHYPSAYFIFFVPFHLRLSRFIYAQTIIIKWRGKNLRNKFILINFTISNSAGAWEIEII